MTQNPQSQNPQFQAQNPYSMTLRRRRSLPGQYSRSSRVSPASPVSLTSRVRRATIRVSRGYPAQAPQQMQQAPFARGAIISAPNLQSYGNNGAA